jgi:branched-chain amino acid transport system substrate-binding protein
LGVRADDLHALESALPRRDRERLHVHVREPERAHLLRRPVRGIALRARAREAGTEERRQVTHHRVRVRVLERRVAQSSRGVFRFGGMRGNGHEQGEQCASHLLMETRRSCGSFVECHGRTAGGNERSRSFPHVHRLRRCCSASRRARLRYVPRILMNRHLLPLTFTLVMLLSCAPPEQPVGGSRSTSGDIVIGEYGSMTGSEATFGQSTHDGIMLAVEEINAAGGLHGRKVRVITEDDQSKAEEAANAVTKLISANDVVAILGEVASSSSLAAAPICQSSKVPMITPSSTNPRVTRVGDYIFRMCFIDTYQGPVVARFLANDAGVKTAALFTDLRSDYSRGLAEAFEQVFTASGGRIVARQSFSKGDNDYRSQLTAIKQAKPEVIFVPGYYSDVAPIAVQARDLGMNVPLVGGDGWESPKLLEIGGKALEGSMYSNHYHVDDPAPAVREFVTKYRKRYGVAPDSLAALGYDAMRVLADAIRRAGPAFDRARLRDALAATKDFPVVTGVITFDADRNPIGKRVVIDEIKDGRIILRKTIDPV